MLYTLYSATAPSYGPIVLDEPNRRSFHLVEPGTARRRATPSPLGVLHLINGRALFRCRARVQDLLACASGRLWAVEVAFACLKLGMFALDARSQDCRTVRRADARSRARHVSRCGAVGRPICGQTLVSHLLHTHTPRCALVGRIALLPSTGVPLVLSPAQPDGQSTRPAECATASTLLVERAAWRGAARVLSPSPRTWATTPRAGDTLKPAAGSCYNGVADARPASTIARSRLAALDTSGSVARFPARARGLKCCSNALAFCATKGLPGASAGRGAIRNRRNTSKQIKTPPTRGSLLRKPHRLGTASRLTCAASSNADGPVRAAQPVRRRAADGICWKPWAAGVPVVAHAHVEGVPGGQFATASTDCSSDLGDA